MNRANLEALRRRARAGRVSPGVVAKAERALDHQSYLQMLRREGIPRDWEGGRTAETAPVRVDGARVWRVACCRPSQAIGVASDLSALGFVAYCPTGRKIIFRGAQRGFKVRKRRIHSYPVFGDYLFVGEVDMPLQVSLHEDIIGVLGDSRGAYRLNPKFLQAIIDREASGVWDEARALERREFTPGERVRVKRGSYADLQGLVMQCDTAGVSLKIEMFGRDHEVVVKDEALERVG